MVVLVFSLAYIDSRKKRKTQTYHPFISFIIPCYNDEKSIEEAIKSVYNSYNNFELFVINDKSKDNSLNIIKKLKKKYKFTFVNNKENIGKSKSVNLVSKRTIGEILFIVDSDVVLTGEAVEDILKRFSSNRKIAAISCPYKAKNSGFLSKMQDIDYNISKMTKYAQNLISVLALWGGCLAVNRSAFFEVGKFSENALVEDVDLSLKLFKKGYKVEQSSVYVKTVVPSTVKSLIKQRVRWTSGGAQCFLTHTKMYFKSPLHVIFGFGQIALVITFVFYFSHYLLSSLEIFNRTFSITNPGGSFGNFLNYVWLVDKKIIVRGVFIKFGLMTFILPYVIMTVKSWKEAPKLIYAIPFAILYSPVLTVIWAYGWVKGTKKYFELKDHKRTRAW